MKSETKRVVAAIEKLKRAGTQARELNAASRAKKDARDAKLAEARKTDDGPRQARTRRGEFGGEDVSKKATAYDLESLFRELQQERLGFKALVSRWSRAELSIGRRLLDGYGDELTFGAARFFFERFSEYSADAHDKVAREPTVNRLWAVRNEVFADYQMQEHERTSPRPPEPTTLERPPAHRSDKGRGEDQWKAPKNPVGWGDEEEPKDPGAHYGWKAPKNPVGWGDEEEPKDPGAHYGWKAPKNPVGWGDEEESESQKDEYVDEYRSNAPRCAVGQGDEGKALKHQNGKDSDEFRPELARSNWGRND